MKVGIAVILFCCGVGLIWFNVGPNLAYHGKPLRYGFSQLPLGQGCNHPLNRAFPQVPVF